MHLAHVAPYDSDFHSTGEHARLYSITQRLQGHQLQFAYAIACAIDARTKGLSVDLQLGAGLGISCLSEPDEIFEPIHVDQPSKRNVAQRRSKARGHRSAKPLTKCRIERVSRGSRMPPGG